MWEFYREWARLLLALETAPEAVATCADCEQRENVQFGSELEDLGLTLRACLHGRAATNAYNCGNTRGSDCSAAMGTTPEHKPVE